MNENTEISQTQFLENYSQQLELIHSASHITADNAKIENSTMMKTELTDESSTEEMDITEEPTEEMTAVFTSKTGDNIAKAGIFFGLTSGSFLIGLSTGFFFASGKSNNMLIITEVVGTSLLGYSSYKFWAKKDEDKMDFWMQYFQSQLLL